MSAALLDPPAGLRRFEQFVASLDALVRSSVETPILLELGAVLLGDLVAEDDWLPESHDWPIANRYAQHLLHRARDGAFSIVAFVWGPGQSTPVHDHRVWGLVGVLRGAELVRDFRRDAEDGLAATGDVRRLEAGAVDAIDPAAGDIHQVANAHDDSVSISIHVYGADISLVERATYDAFGRPKAFVSGYSDTPVLLP